MTNTTTWGALQKRLDSIKRPTASFTICEDPDVRQRLHEAKAADQGARQNLTALKDDTDEQVKLMVTARAATATKELKTAQAAYDKASVTLRFTAIERKHLETLQKAHPPTEEDAENGQDWALETFAPELIEAASLDGMPAEYARHCLDTWSNADATNLWLAAWSIQHQQRTDLGKG